MAGRVVHRSIYLGSDDAPELLQRVRQLLQHFRTLADGLEEIPSFARLGAKAADILVRPDRHRGTRQPKGLVTDGVEMG